jgi:hypothetical protein
MVDLGKTAQSKRHCATALVILAGGALVMTCLLVQQLPTELTFNKPAPTAPSAASQPGLFATLLALHPSLPAAHEAVLNALSRCKAALRPEPPLVSHAIVIYVADEHGNFVPIR